MTSRKIRIADRASGGACARIVVAAIAASVAAASCAGSRRADVDPRYLAVRDTLTAMGLVQIGPAQHGVLREGQSARLAVDLAPQCVTLVVVGGEAVRGLDVALLDPSGKVIGHDATHDQKAVLRACVDVSGEYVAIVHMTAGAGTYVAAAWSGGGDASAGDASGLSLTSDAASTVDAKGAGTCASPIAVTAGSTTGTTAAGESNHYGSCAKNDARELVYKLEIKDRQRVVVDVAAQFDSVVYLRKGSCEDAGAEVACNDDAPNADRSKVDVTLDPGTYFVFVDGLSREAGAFRMSVALQDVPLLLDVCRRARVLTPGAPATVATTQGGFDNANASCGQGARGHDVPYRLDLGQRARVRITQHSDEVQPVVHLRRVCEGEPSEVACADTGLGSEEATFVGVLPKGAYTVFADTRDRDATGRYTLRAETAPEQGTSAAGDGCGDAIALVGNEKVSGDTFFAKDDVSGSCGGSGAPDVVYRLELARRSRVSARFDDEESRHVLHLARRCGDRGAELACATHLDESLAAGVYFLAVDGLGADGFGRFDLDVRVRDIGSQEAACKNPPHLTLGQRVSATTSGAGDRFATSCGGKDDTQASLDRVYKLVLAARARVRLELTTPTWDGVLALRRSCADAGASARASEIACNNDADGPSKSRIDTTLEAGTYFVVVDGHGPASEGAFTLDYK
jgi:hypothetical protein